MISKTLPQLKAELEQAWAEHKAQYQKRVEREDQLRRLPKEELVQKIQAYHHQDQSHVRSEPKMILVGSVLDLELPLTYFERRIQRLQKTIQEVESVLPEVDQKVNGAGEWVFPEGKAPVVVNSLEKVGKRHYQMTLNGEVFDIYPSSENSWEWVITNQIPSPTFTFKRWESISQIRKHFGVLNSPSAPCSSPKTR